jgi:hypothetical protein
VAEASCFGASGAAPGTKKAKKGVVLDNFGVFLAQFGVVLDNNGVIKDKFGNTKTQQNRVFDTKNNENTIFPRLIPSKSSSPAKGRWP